MFEESSRKIDSKMGRTETFRAYQNNFAMKQLNYTVEIFLSDIESL